MHRLVVLMSLLIVTAGQGLAVPSSRRGPPRALGSCAFTRISWIGQRLEDPLTHRVIADSGSAVNLADGVHGVSYDEVPAVNASRVGDPVMTCLAELPTHCPPGDERGRWYTTTNLRTKEAWTLPDAEHECGGA